MIRNENIEIKDNSKKFIKSKIYEYIKKLKIKIILIKTSY